MRVASDGILNRLLRDVPTALLRAGCVVPLCVWLTGCGGSGDGAAPPTSTSTTAPAPDPGTSRPPAPATLIVGTALSIDGGASGNPVGLRVARSANGDGFAVWQADDGTRRNLWANRYGAAAATWGTPINIEASSADIDAFDLAVDANGNATVAWHEPPDDPTLGSGVVMGVRFDSGPATWATPVPLSSDGTQPRVASDATGAVLAVYVAVRGHLVRGRFFDPISGIWQPEAAIEQNTTATGFSFGPVAVLDGSGNALSVWQNARTGAGAIAGNYFSRSEGRWFFQIPPGEVDNLGGVPGSFTTSGGNDNVQVVATAGGDFLAVWQRTFFEDPATSAEIWIARFATSSRTWSEAQTLVPRRQTLQLQRIGSDADGNALLLWTENDGMRTALKASWLPHGSATCSAVHVIDSAVGGGAARADVAVDPLGRAMAIWQQFEGGRPDDGSRSNIAINRFDGAWASAALAEMQPGNAIGPRASASGGQALLGWIQSESGANRVKALLQPLADTPDR